MEAARASRGLRHFLRTPRGPARTASWLVVTNKRVLCVDARPEEPASEPEPISDSAANIAESSVVAGDEAAPEGEQPASSPDRGPAAAASQTCFTTKLSHF